MYEETIQDLQKKIKALEDKVQSNEQMFFVYIQTVLTLLKDKNVFSPGEYRKTLRKYKVEFEELEKEAELMDLMKKLKKKFPH
jgi:hypothetical protein